MKDYRIAKPMMLVVGLAILTIGLAGVLGAQGKAVGTTTGEKPTPPASKESVLQTTGPDVRAEAAAGINSYLRVVGSVLRPRSNSVPFTTGGNGGTIHVTGLPLDWFNTPVHLPQGALVKYVRMYYYDAHKTYDCDGYFSIYDNQGNVVQEWQVASAASPGYSSSLSAYIAHTVDNLNYSYALNWMPQDIGATLALAGFRINYDAPVTPNKVAVIPLF